MKILVSYFEVEFLLEKIIRSVCLIFGSFSDQRTTNHEILDEINSVGSVKQERDNTLLKKSGELYLSRIATASGFDLRFSCSGGETASER